MIRFLLFLLFFVMLMADTLGLNLSLAPGLSVKNAFLYMIFATIAIETALARNRKLESLSVIFPFALAVLYAIFTWLVMILIVQHPEYKTLSTLISLKSAFADHLFVFLVFFYGVTSKKDALWLIKAILWVVLIVNIVSVVDYFNIPNLDIVQEIHDGRMRGPIDEPNQYASFLILFLPSIFALAYLERGALRLFAIVGFAASVLALMTTASRGGAAGFLVGGILGAFYLRKFISGRQMSNAVVGTLILGTLATAALYVSGVGDETFGRLIGQTLTGNVYDASSGRSFLWASPITLVTGFGWEAYRQIFDFRMAPHNSYLKFFFELGLVGLSLIMMTLFNVFSTARHGMQSITGTESIFLFTFILGFFAFLVSIFFVDLYSPWLFAWAFVGVVLRVAVEQRADFQRSNIPRGSHQVRRDGPVSGHG